MRIHATVGMSGVSVCGRLHQLGRFTHFHGRYGVSHFQQDLTRSEVVPQLAQIILQPFAGSQHQSGSGQASHSRVVGEK